MAWWLVSGVFVGFDAPAAQIAVRPWRAGRNICFPGHSCHRRLPSRPFYLEWRALVPNAIGILPVGIGVLDAHGNIFTRHGRQPHVIATGTAMVWCVWLYAHYFTWSGRAGTGEGSAKGHEVDSSTSSNRPSVPPMFWLPINSHVRPSLPYIGAKVAELSRAPRRLPHRFEKPHHIGALLRRRSAGNG